MKKLIHIGFMLMALMISYPTMAMLPSIELKNTDTTHHQVQIKITSSLVTTDSQGQEILTPITDQTPLQSGQVIEYHGYLFNRGNERIRSMKVTLDIPQGMQLFSIQTVSPARPLGTGNGKIFQPLPIKAKINGVLQELPLVYYKALRWEIKGLGLNEVATVKYRVQVK